MKRSTPLRRSSFPSGKKRKPRKGVSPASEEQRGKVVLDGVCRVCKADRDSRRLDPAHVVDRSIGGCDCFECIVPLCRRCHESYDAHTLDLLPYLTLAEQAHAVSHLGLTRALRRITGERHVPESEREAAA